MISARSAGMPAHAPAPQARTIPFDYAFRYELEGRPGRVINDTVTVSIEATYVAVSIGYGVIPILTPVTLAVGPPTQPGVLRRGVIRDVLSTDLRRIMQAIQSSLPETSPRARGETIFAAVLKNGIRLNPAVAEQALRSIEGSDTLEVSIADRLFQVVSPPAEQVQFKYALFDEGSGREFQSEPILNTAGLGISNGDRPFRYFPRPIVFKPRSTIRLEITEVSDFEGDLHISLQGYKVLGQAGTPTAVARRRVPRR